MSAPWHSLFQSSIYIHCFASCSDLGLQIRSVWISLWINEIIRVFISIVCNISLHFRLREHEISCKLQIWIRPAWISTIRPCYIASSDIESDFVPQTRSIQFVSIPSRRKWRLLVYRTSVPQLKQKDWLLVQILRISFQNQPLAESCLWFFEMFADEINSWNSNWNKILFFPNKNINYFWTCQFQYILSLKELDWRLFFAE